MENESCLQIYKRAISLFNIGKYNKAILLSNQAELCARERYPKASCLKGECFYYLEKYEKAIEAYTMAEMYSKDGKFPDASLGKGRSHLLLGQYEKAIEAYNKAERDSEDGKLPIASYLIGKIHYTFREYKKAIDSFTKAEEDSKNGKFPVASNSKGDCHVALGEDKKAIEAFTKAEDDSKDGKAPDISYNKGNCQYKLGEYRKAIESYTKAEVDSKNGKDPVASYNKGNSHRELREYGKAIEAYTKAEDDSKDGKHPGASNNKGLIHRKLEEYDKAIEAFTKAEDDSKDGKSPVASFNKAMLFFKLGHYNLAENFLYKAINDHSPKIHINAHWLLSICLYKFGDYKRAKEHAFIALGNSHRDLKIVKNIYELFSDHSTITIYEQRKIYLERLNILDVERLFELFDDESIAQTGHRNLFLSKLYDFNEGFLRILMHKTADLPENITYEQRLRTAYLLYFLKGNYHGCFHVLDTLMDDNFGHGPLESWFYALSCYLIGEPVSELQALANSRIGNMDWLSESWNVWNRQLSEALENKRYLDPYLLKLSLPDKILGHEPIPDTYHPWVNDLLKQLKVGASTYLTPISDNMIKGVEVQIFNERYFLAQEEVPEELREWAFFKLSIASIVRQESGFKGSIKDIRNCISKGVPYAALLLFLMDAYGKVEDPSLKKGLAVLLSSVLLSEQIDNKKNISPPKGLLLGALESLAIDGFLYYMDIGTFGVGPGISIIIEVVRHITGETMEKRTRLIFDKLNEDIENLNLH